MPFLQQHTNNTRPLLWHVCPKWECRIQPWGNKRRWTSYEITALGPWKLPRSGKAKQDWRTVVDKRDPDSWRLKANNDLGCVWGQKWRVTTDLMRHMSGLNIDLGLTNGTLSMWIFPSWVLPRKQLASWKIHIKALRDQEVLSVMPWRWSYCFFWGTLDLE